MTVEARLVRLARCRWLPDRGSRSVRTVVRCPWHASEISALVIGAIREGDDVYPTYWHCIGCRRCGLARCDGDSVRLDWTGVEQASVNA